MTRLISVIFFTASISFWSFWSSRHGGGPGLRRIGSMLRREGRSAAAGEGAAASVAVQAHLGLGAAALGAPVHQQGVGLGKARLWKRLGVGIHFLVRGGSLRWGSLWWLPCRFKEDKSRGSRAAKSRARFLF